MKTTLVPHQAKGRPLVYSPDPCRVCRQRPATLFAVFHDRSLRRKAHLCLDCYEKAASCPGLRVETISQQEFNVIPVNTFPRQELNPFEP